jgi:hypothetical protein
MSLNDLNLKAPSLDFKPVLGEIRDMAKATTLECFDGLHDPDGVPWAPLAKYTVREKTRKGAPDPERILFEWGPMLASFEAGAIDEITDTSMEWGTDEWKASLHDPDGDAPSRANLPIRRMVGYSDKQVKEVEDMVAQAVERQIANAF